MNSVQKGMTKRMIPIGENIKQERKRYIKWPDMRK